MLIPETRALLLEMVSKFTFLTTLQPGCCQRTRFAKPDKKGSTGNSLGTSQFMDHPHARGENVDDHPQVKPENGPSPRTWGEQGQCSRIAFLASDHPHARGENEIVPIEYLELLGPSPRTWGERE